MDRRARGGQTRSHATDLNVNRSIALLALLGAGSVHAQSALFDNLVRSPYVHCEFYKAYAVDSLTHFQRIRGDRARQISTRAAGAREVRVAHTEKYVHFIDSVAGMFVLTTVTGCLERGPRGVCATYGAMQSRHFDARVLTDPDSVYERLQGRSDPGFCDHSFFGVRETPG
jgi:hypothetical protein